MSRNYSYTTKFKRFSTICFPVFFSIMYLVQDEIPFLIPRLRFSFEHSIIFCIIIYVIFGRKIANFYQDLEDKKNYTTRMKLEFEFWEKRIRAGQEFNERIDRILQHLKEDFDKELQNNPMNAHNIINKMKELKS